MRVLTLVIPCTSRAVLMLSGTSDNIVGVAVGVTVAVLIIVVIIIIIIVVLLLRRTKRFDNISVALN